MRLGSIIVGSVALILFAVVVLTAGDVLLRGGEEAAGNVVPAAQAEPERDAGEAPASETTSRVGAECASDDRTEAGDDSDSTGEDDAGSSDDDCDDQADDEQAGDDEAGGEQGGDDQAGDNEPDENERGNGDDAADRGEGEGD